VQTELTRTYVTYQAQSKLLELAVEIAENPRFNKDEIKEKLAQVTKIRLWLRALRYYTYLDQEKVELLVYCLADLCDANAIPYAPVVTTVEPPSILVGIPGADGSTGATGPEGGGIPFSSLNVAASQVIDSFDISASPAVEYRLRIEGVAPTSGLRVMRILGGWSEDGSDFGDDGGDGTDDIYGDTSDVAISVQVIGTTAQLYATITSGTWNFTGTRVYIPNIGTSVVTPTQLADGQIWVGNASDVATAVEVTGDISIDNTGAVTITKAVAYSATSTPQEIIKKIDIGTWNMDSDFSVTVSHGIANGVSKIESISVKIYNDAQGQAYPLSYSGAGIAETAGTWSWDDNDVTLIRSTSAFFDSTDFNSTLINRGTITIRYHE
jgi:hypothetical protein